MSQSEKRTSSSHEPCNSRPQESRIPDETAYSIRISKADGNQTLSLGMISLKVVVNQEIQEKEEVLMRRTPSCLLQHVLSR